MYKSTRKGIEAHIRYKLQRSIDGATAKRFRFHRDGRISAYGAIPNANHAIGWWLVGTAEGILADIHQAVRAVDAIYGFDATGRN